MFKFPMLGSLFGGGGSPAPTPPPATSTSTSHLGTATPPPGLSDAGGGSEDDDAFPQSTPPPTLRRSSSRIAMLASAARPAISGLLWGGGGGSNSGTASPPPQAEYHGPIPRECVLDNDLFYTYPSYLRDHQAKIDSSVSRLSRRVSMTFRRRTEVAESASASALSAWAEAMAAQNAMAAQSAVDSAGSGSESLATDDAASMVSLSSSSAASTVAVPVPGPDPVVPPLDDKDFLRILTELDIARITPRVIACGLPWRNRSERASQRNNMHDLARFLDLRYKSRYLVFNLAEAINYDVSVFHQQIVHFDLSQVSIKALLDVARAVASWLAMDSRNVAIVHCHNGKARTGLAVACVLEYLGIFPSAADALDLFLHRRSPGDSAWVTATHRRYVAYFHDVLAHGGAVAQPRALALHRIVVHALPIPSRTGDAADTSVTYTPGLEVHTQGKLVYYKDDGQDLEMDEYGVLFNVAATDGAVPLNSDVTIRVFYRVQSRDACRSQTVLHFAFNTGFMDPGVHRIHPEDMEVASSVTNDLAMDLVLAYAPASSPRSVHAELSPTSAVIPGVGPGGATGLSYTKLLDRSPTRWLAKLSQAHFVRPHEPHAAVLERQGFTRVLARFALQRANNDLHTATELLLRDLVKSPVYAEISAELKRQGQAKFDAIKRKKGLGRTSPSPPLRAPSVGSDEGTANDDDATSVASSMYASSAAASPIKRVQELRAGGPRAPSTTEKPLPPVPGSPSFVTDAPARQRADTLESEVAALVSVAENDDNILGHIENVLEAASRTPSPTKEEVSAVPGADLDPAAWSLLNEIESVLAADEVWSAAPSTAVSAATSPVLRPVETGSAHGT
ncbi:hypothetical protein AMAG_04485 [Allomyces macrogynus ATCC 38327]|uniref:Phosphatidylinositol-3,4,5-trisphosphate 3-phosphatase n=1 Tax=Allomyces macrogynus (strain ATCC 38327) TaxID=578462 RepID=A0A0L0S5C8_ALLM3|nr:hypothetical protein AMAG_04485 [Allomyces macrogynus ATCC 38327]|eukprot:KNE57621.1 hypothetical protein AMAG_04485 [Allomyces macrogynus ATCC 38327]